MLSRHLVAGFLAAVASAATVPLGTGLQVRLTSTVSSDKPAGQPVTAVVTAPVLIQGNVLIPAGTRLTGHTADARPAQAANSSTGAEEQIAQLRLIFDSIEDSPDHHQHISCLVSGIDNAREAVDSNGLITGIKASETFASRIDQGINKVSQRNQQLADLLGGVRSALLQPVDASITYGAGVELVVTLTRALDWKPSIPQRPVNDINPGDELVRLVNAEPSRTTASNPPKPSDLTNLMFIGTAEEVTRAFQTAGWSTAAQLGRDSRMETARAIIEDRGYQEAPMSVLTLDGRPPDFTFQKQNDTFYKRHHIRIWQRPDTFNGKPVWVAAATHDTGVNFSQESRTITHVIDSNIDAERSKVVSDLLFTNLVHGLALVERANIPPNLSNATGDILQSDRKMAVLAF